MELARAVAMAAAGLCLGVILAGLWGFPRTRLMRPLLGVAGCAALWALGDQFAEYSTDLVEEQVGIAILYTGSLFMPSLWWLLALRWASESGWPLALRERYWVGVPLAWAGVMWLIMLTNPWHGQFLTPAPGRNVKHALWWVAAVPSYGLNAVTIGALAWVATRVPDRSVRRQAAFVIGAIAILGGSSLTYVLWPDPPPFNASVLVIGIAGALIFLGMRTELERRRFEQRLRAEVAQRTEQLDAANRQLRLTNSRLRELQAKLVRAERLDAAEYLAGAVAHAIHNPLAALRGTLEVAAARGDDDPAVDRALHLADRVRDVVDGTLDLVRRSALRLEAKPPSRLLEDARDELAERAESQGVRVDVRCAAGLPEPLVDWPLFVAALVALAENALDAMPGGGRLTLQAEPVPGDHALAFTVADTGPGIPETMRAKAFEPFFTTRPDGTGLGLAIARGVVQGHGGRIHLADAPGGGALVRVEIPVRGATPPAPPRD